MILKINKYIDFQVSIKYISNNFFVQYLLEGIFDEKWINGRMEWWIKGYG